jgi:histidyl-tRNA synthetase
VGELIKTPRGTRDLLPADTRLWQKVEAALRRVFGAYGYEEIRTPLFEATELFVRGIGEGTDIVGKEMYSFHDRKGRSLTLRPEGTAGVVRAYAEHALGAGENGEAKLYYIGPMFRYERPQAGRYRQFWQAGVEAIGFADPLADAEVVAMLVQGLAEAGLKGLSVDINSVGCRDCRPAYLELLKAHLKAHASELSAESQQRLLTNPMRILDSKDPQDAEVVDAAPKTTNHLCSACSAHFAAVLRHLERAGVEHQVNKKLVRGLDYYSRTAFEVLSGDLGAQNAVAGGGRYDSLVGELSGTDRPSVGFGMGLDRLVQLLSSPSAEGPSAPAQVAVICLGSPAYGVGFGLAQELRALGVSVWMDLSRKRGMKNQMKTAGGSGVRYALILGEDELAKGEASVKDMNSGEQAALPLKGLAAAIAGKLK